MFFATASIAEDDCDPQILHASYSYAQNSDYRYHIVKARMVSEGVDPEMTRPEPHYAAVRTVGVSLGAKGKRTPFDRVITMICKPDMSCLERYVDTDAEEALLIFVAESEGVYFVDARFTCDDIVNRIMMQPRLIYPAGEKELNYVQGCLDRGKCETPQSRELR